MAAPFRAKVRLCATVLCCLLLQACAASAQVVQDNAAFVFVVDKSRSMIGARRMDLVKTALFDAFSVLDDKSAAGLVGFDDSPFIVIPLQPGRHARDAASRIKLLFPGRKTDILAGVNEGLRMLRGSPAAKKHLILITDTAPEELPAFESQVPKEVRCTTYVLEREDEPAGRTHESRPGVRLIKAGQLSRELIDFILVSQKNAGNAGRDR